MSTGKYFVRLRGRTSGPFSVSELSAMRARGRLSSFHEISEDHISWAFASTLEDVFTKDKEHEAVPGTSGIEAENAKHPSSGSAALPKGMPPIPNSSSNSFDRYSLSKPPVLLRVLIGLIGLAIIGGGLFVLNEMRQRERAEEQRMIRERSEADERRQREERDRRDGERQEKEANAQLEEAYRVALAQAQKQQDEMVRKRNEDVDKLISSITPMMKDRAKAEARSKHTASNVELATMVGLETEENAASRLVIYADYDVFMRGNLFGLDRFRVRACSSDDNESHSSEYNYRRHCYIGHEVLTYL